MIRSEHDEQAALIDWCYLKQKKNPDYRQIFAIPNGGHRRKATAAKLKQEGVMPGVPDLLLAVAKNGKHGLFIEMKSAKGRITANQRVWQDRLVSYDYAFVVARGFDEAKAAIEKYLE